MIHPHPSRAGRQPSPRSGVVSNKTPEMEVKPVDYEDQGLLLTVTYAIHRWRFSLPRPS